MTTFEKIYRQVISKLENELPPGLYYHSTDHTKYVLRMAEFLAEKEGVSGRDLFLLKVAALYHDTGFTVGREDHEETSCSIASEELPGYGLTSEEIKKVCSMILATRLPQQPKTKLEKILADADLEYLGTDKFEKVGELLYKEMAFLQPEMDKEKWHEIEKKFLHNHKYHTKFCRENREPKKSENLEKVKRKLEIIKSDTSR